MAQIQGQGKTTSEFFIYLLIDSLKLLQRLERKYHKIIEKFDESHL